jgi:hypothetical protein
MAERELAQSTRLAPRLALVTLGSVAIAAAAALPGCGGGSSDRASAGTSKLQLAEAAGLPRPSGRSLRALIGNYTQGPQLAPSVSVLQPGLNRFGFGLFDRANRQLGDVTAAIYIARGVDDTAHGPYPARYESIEVQGRFRSKTTADDPNAATAVYVARVPFPRNGGYVVVAVAKLGNNLVATSPVQTMVGSRRAVPRVGDRAIRVHTPTRASVGGDVKKIDTRVPPDSMHDVDLADALAQHRPILLLFATPALCQSRVCGPVTDVAEQVKSELGNRAAFIHMEIYKDNEVSKGLRPQVRAWHLATEPWAFAIDSRGRIRERLEGAFSVGELEAAVHKALGG